MPADLGLGGVGTDVVGVVDDERGQPEQTLLNGFERANALCRHRVGGFVMRGEFGHRTFFRFWRTNRVTVHLYCSTGGRKVVCGLG